MLRSVYLSLNSSEVQLWPVVLTEWREHLKTLSGLLSEDEQQRASRFLFEKDRDAFTIRRGVLRLLFSMYLNRLAGEIRFIYSANGKPFVYPQTDLQFSSSHSGRLAVIAFTRGCELGVDVERIEPLEESDSIARVFFHRQEMENDTPQEFYRCWTKKEAYGKATGQGLLSSAPESFALTTWTFQYFDLQPDYAGAVAYRSESKILRTMNTRQHCTSVLRKYWTL